MTKEAFETINEGLQEALAVARGDAEPYSVHQRGGYTMSPAREELFERVNTLLEQARKELE